MNEELIREIEENEVYDTDYEYSGYTEELTEIGMSDWDFL